MKRLKQTILMGVAMAVISLPIVEAAHLPTDEVKINARDYKALKVLVKHGVVTDLHGLDNFGHQSYTREELVPLIMDAVNKKDTLNDSDKNRVEELSSDYTEEIRAEKWKRMRAEEERLADEAARKAELNNSSKQVQVSEAEQHKLDEASLNSGLEPKKMSQTEIAKKMQNFIIDDSQVKVKREVPIRYTKTKKS